VRRERHGEWHTEITMTARPGRASVEAGPYRVAQALGEAVTAGQVAEAIFEHALRDLGAATVGLWLVGEDGVLRYSAGAGLGTDDVAPGVGDIPLDADIPGAIAVRTGAPVVYGSLEERDTRWPALRGLRSAGSGVVVLPLVTADRTLGCLHVGWPQEAVAPFDPDVALLEGLAKVCAAALDRALLHERERRARETLEFLNQATRLMVSALEPDAIVRSLVRLAVPRLAPWCAVYVAEGRHLHRVAVEVADDPELSRLVLAGGPVPVDTDKPLGVAYRTRQPLTLPEVGPEHVIATYEPELAERILSLSKQRWSALVVPVEARGEILGVMSLLSPDWGGAPPQEVCFAAEGLAGRAGVALDNARRLASEADNVAVLTAALLPEGVPTLDSVRFAVRCVPAWGGVCGDWYEAELLPGGAVVVGVGDASGHGISAAAAMAQVRNAARGLAAAGMGPAEMLDHLSHLVLRGRAHSMVTAQYGLFDPGTGRGSFANAGHPPPLRVSRDGQVEVISRPLGPPIGLGERPYVQEALELPPGGRLVFYTDGLYERRGEDPDLGIGRLIDLVRAHAGRSEDELADVLMASRTDSSDDGCVLVVGRP
jgi:serine phosphatase RsbU (regulator of sigma subunit)